MKNIITLNIFIFTSFFFLVSGCGTKTGKQLETINVKKDFSNYNIIINESIFTKRLSEPSVLSIYGSIENLDKVNLEFYPKDKFWIINEREQKIGNMEFVYSFDDEMVTSLSNVCRIKPNKKIEFKFYYQDISESEINNLKLYWGNNEFKILLKPEKN